MHAPHYRAQPPGWLRSRAGRLWRRLADGRTATLFPPDRWHGWRLGLYGTGGVAEYVAVKGASVTANEADAARAAASQLGERPPRASWTVPDTG